MWFVRTVHYYQLNSVQYLQYCIAWERGFVASLEETAPDVSHQRTLVNADGQPVEILLKEQTSN